MLKNFFMKLSNLVNVGCEPVLSLELKSNRSIIVHSVDRGIMNHEVGEIKREVHKCNGYGESLEAFKLCKSIKVQIVLNFSVMADL